MLWFESPSNPLLKVHDIVKITTLCKAKGVLTVFDNTLATPLYLNPCELGVDIILHSGTKLLAGHSDVIVGFVSTDNEVLYKRLCEMNGRISSEFY
jgi:cystathionine beta-lyase/cystathionine gamma-synthase